MSLVGEFVKTKKTKPAEESENPGLNNNTAGFGTSFSPFNP
jgi:hypothetical protein